MSETADLIYSRLVADEKLKNGTAYERLAAIVFRMLYDDVTVHDLRLVGRSEVKHQIDVTVGDGEESRRILIECKDYQTKVGLDIVRSFSAVVGDVCPDEAFIVTTEGFTKDAETFAGAHGIRLAYLRPPQSEEDWDRIVREIRLTIKIFSTTNRRISFHPSAKQEAMLSESEFDRSAEAYPDEVTVIGPDQVPARLRTVLEETVTIPKELGEFSQQVMFDEPRTLIAEGMPTLLVDGFTFSATGTEAQLDDVVVGEGIGGLAAELVLRTSDGRIHQIFTNRQFSEWRFEDGRVEPRV